MIDFFIFIGWTIWLLICAFVGIKTMYVFCKKDIHFLIFLIVLIFFMIIPAFFVDEIEHHSHHCQEYIIYLKDN